MLCVFPKKNTYVMCLLLTSICLNFLYIYQS